MGNVKTLRSRVKAGDTLLGCFITWPTGGIAELLALAGFDFVLLDTEHGVFSPDSLLTTLAACDGAGIPAMVRVLSSPSLEAARCLDYGSAGILFPRAENVQAVRAAVEMVKYPPEGKRGLAGVRANKYGVRPLAQFVTEANAETLMAIQIETSGGLGDIRSICNERDVDVVYVGPNDLTQALGIPGQYQHPSYLQALAQISTAAKDGGKAAGIMLAKTEQIGAYRKLGYRFFTTSDRVVFIESARAWRAAFQNS